MTAPVSRWSRDDPDRSGAPPPHLDALTETRYHLPSMTEPTTVQAALDDAGYRRTGARRSITDLIAARKGPFTAADLVADARSKRLGVGRPTVFRTLHVLADLHAVERPDLPSGYHAYVACAPVHHHHAVTSECAASPDVDDA